MEFVRGEHDRISIYGHSGISRALKKVLYSLVFGNISMYYFVSNQGLLVMRAGGVG